MGGARIDPGPRISDPTAIKELYFRPIDRTGDLDRPLDDASVYRNIVLKYGRRRGERSLCAFAARHGGD